MPYNANCQEGHETGECPLLYDRCPDRHDCVVYQEQVGFGEETEEPIKSDRTIKNDR
jgi:hypothetical protein